MSVITPLNPELGAVPGAEDVADVLGVLGEDLGCNSIDI